MTGDLGAGYYQFQIRNGQRETSARAWYGEQVYSLFLPLKRLCM
jgi:hypothetical protein